MRDAFRVIRRIGSGGMATVFLAEQVSLGREVALKVLKRELALDADYVARLMLEARLVAQFRHRHIITIHDVGIWEETPYIAMEYLPLGSIVDLDRAMSPRDALRCVREVASALDHAHKHGVVHRDVKPENILCHESGAFVLTDFGIAHSDNARRPTTGDGIAIGTPGYMSPEQLRGGPVDGRSDLYSLGVVLRELLVGCSLPNDPGSNLESRHPTPSLPAHLAMMQGLLAGLLATDRDERFPSAAQAIELAESLEREGSVPHGPPSDSTPHRPPRISRLLREWPHQAAANLFSPEERRAPPRPAMPRLRLALGALVLLALLLAAGAFLRAPHQPTPHSVAVFQFRDLSPAQEYSHIAEGISDEIHGMLAEVRGLRVAGRVSTSLVESSMEPIADTAEALAVDAIVEGSIKIGNGRLRVVAKITETTTGNQIWARIYDRSISDLVLIETEIARSVVEILRVKVSADHSFSAAHSSVPEAQEQFLLARQLAKSATISDNQRSSDAYARALELDPNFAAAWAGLASTRYFLAEGAESPEAREAMRNDAISAVERAIRIDPGLSEGHRVRAMLRHLVELDWDGAENDYQRALALRPGDSDALRTYAVLLASLGRFGESISLSRESLLVDPLSARAWTNLARAQMCTGDFKQAQVSIDRALQISPNGHAILFNAGVLSLLSGRPSQAVEFFDRISPTHYLYDTGFAISQHIRGKHESAVRLIEALQDGATRRPYAAGMAFLAIGEQDRAFAAFEAARVQRDDWIATIKGEPLVVPLRADRRFMALLDRLGLPR